MDRNRMILKDINESQKGIEIAPWHSPIAPKKLGFNCRSLDVFPTLELLKRAINDKTVDRESINRIEDVDFVGNALEIESIVGNIGELHSFDYIISSHNFEHLSNPIKFLKGCGNVLKDGGVLSMAIPDKRTCFDFYRPLTITSDILESYFTDQSNPTLKQVYESETFFSVLEENGALSHSFDLKSDTSRLINLGNIKNSYDKWIRFLNIDDNNYQDAHCGIYTKNSFELIINELFFLGLIPFDLLNSSETLGNEFIVQLKNVGYSSMETTNYTEFQLKRQNLLNKIQDDLALNAPGNFKNQPCV